MCSGLFSAKGHPFGYLDQAAIDQNGDEDTRRLVREYDPSWEFVTSLFKSLERVSSYRIGVLAVRENLGGREEQGPGSDVQQEDNTYP